MKSLEGRIKGPGPGRESAVRSLNNVGYKITNIIDVTPIPHNGCRPPKSVASEELRKDGSLYRSHLQARPSRRRRPVAQEPDACVGLQVQAGTETRPARRDQHPSRQAVRLRHPAA